MKDHITLSIPDSLAEQATGLVAKTPEERMEIVVRWSQENVERGEGPFAAGVFRLDTGECVGAGVNRVLSSGCSIAHAEIMAILMAQASTGLIHLSEKAPMVLTSSAQPCSQCYGSIPWSGVTRLEYGAGREAVEAIGFDEGPCPENWREQLLNRGIEVLGPLLAEKAENILRRYSEQSGEIY